MRSSTLEPAWLKEAEVGDMSEPSTAWDTVLAQRVARTGDEDAFHLLVRRYQDKVFRLATSILPRDAHGDAGTCRDQELS